MSSHPGRHSLTSHQRAISLFVHVRLQVLKLGSMVGKVDLAGKDQSVTPHPKCSDSIPSSIAFGHRVYIPYCIPLYTLLVYILSFHCSFLVGRTELNDLMAEHASVSRHHAVLQYGNDGYFYIYDLNSTHGTKINKNAVQPHRYYRLRSVGR